MSEDGEIVLPPGTRYVTADEIPHRVAYALYPEFTGEVTVDFIKKVEVTELGVRNRTLELTPQDWERLREFWATLPPFRAGMRESTWLLYAEAAAAAVNLGWQVVPFTKKGPLGTAALRAAAEERHSEYLKQAIRNGKLTTYDHARLPNAPAQADFPDAGVKVADFAVYVEAFNLRVRVMPSSGVIEAKWVIDNLVTEQAAQSYAAHGYAGQREADKAATLSRIGRDLYNDVFELVQVGAITPVDPGSGVAVDSKATIEPGWRLTREDVEIFLRFVKFTAEGKRDFVLDRKRRQNEGRYTLKRAAMLLARAGERYPALLTRLVSAAEAEEIPTYAPGMYQRLQYGAKPGQQGRVRDWYEEVYWNDLNRWLETHELRIRFRFPNPALESIAGELRTSADFARVTVRDFAERIAAVAADRRPEKWRDAADPDPMRRTIVAAVNTHGWPFDGIPGVLPFIYKELESSRVGALSTFNDLPFSDISEVRANPDKWYLTAEAKDYLLQRIAGAGAETGESKERPQTVQKEAPRQLSPSTGKRNPQAQQQSLGISGKLRRDLLDPAIDKAILAAGTVDTAAVWNELKELALKEEKPFNGSTEKGALCYTDVSDRPRTFNKDALRRRLRVAGRRQGGKRRITDANGG